jgi:hypothetical protein
MRIKRASTIGAALAVSAAFLAGACSSSDGPTGPSGPGQLTVNVSTTGDAGAAFLITITGNGITNPVVASGGDVIYSFPSGNTVKVALIGEHSSGALFKFSVPNIANVGNYGRILHEVAGTDNELLPNGNFVVTITQ